MAAELERNFEDEALSWPVRAKSITISDQRSYDMAADLLKSIAGLEREIQEHHRPVKEAAFNAHKAAVAAEKRLLDPLQEAKTILKRGIGAWDSEQARLRLEAQRKAEEEARKREEEDRLQLAIEAEANGASSETVEEIVNTAQPFTPTVVAPTYQKAQGVSTRQNWKAEVTDLKTLCRAIVEGRASVNLVTANMVALNQMAKAMKSTFNVPGCRAVPEATVAVRRQ